MTKSQNKNINKTKVYEDAKKLLLLRGSNSCQVINEILSDLYNALSPNTTYLKRKNNWTPESVPSSVEYLCEKNHCSLFCFGSHSKKRPFHLSMGRTFDYKILDRVQFRVVSFRSCKEISHGVNPDEPTSSHIFGSKPCILFQGAAFELDEKLSFVKNYLTDFLKGKTVTRVNLLGIDHIWIITSVSEKSTQPDADQILLLRHYKIVLKKSGTRLPRIELEEIGPRLDLSMISIDLAEDELKTLSLKHPKVVVSRPHNKNIRQRSLGRKVGRIHATTQPISSLTTRKFKGLKKGPTPEKT